MLGVILSMVFAHGGTGISAATSLEAIIELEIVLKLLQVGLNRRDGLGDSIAESRGLVAVADVDAVVAGCMCAWILICKRLIE